MKLTWVKVFRINPDFRIFTCQIFPVVKFEGFRGVSKNLICTHALNGTINIRTQFLISLPLYKHSI